MIHNAADQLKKVRQTLLRQIEGLTEEQLNAVPPEFNNNIIWNLAHLIAAQQGLCYLRSGNKPTVPEGYILPFFTNTKPERFIGREEVEEIKMLFITSIEGLQADMDKKIFEHYTASPNILKLYGIELTNIGEALGFLLYHEGYHTGSVLALKKLVTQNG